MVSPTFKAEKEAFVTGFDGTSPFELYIICSSAPISLWAYQHMIGKRNSTSASSNMFTFLLELVMFIVPMILCQSRYLRSHGAAILVTLALFSFSREQRQRNDPKKYASYQRDAVTAFRSSLLFLTFIAILAVDFHVFPRRFVKTEKTGYSLMDIGAASFVLTGGLVSSRARGKTQAHWFKWATHMLPLVVIGLIRLTLQKGLDYQEHVSEYGVHWNFFFTLASLAPLSAILPSPNWRIPIVVMVAYQVVLSIFGLQQWIEDAPRQCEQRFFPLCDLFYANREGILSVVGFSSLYFFTEWVGRALVWVESENTVLWNRMFLGLLFVWGVGTALGIPVSRRSTNLMFLTWILLLNLSLFRVIQKIMSLNSRVPRIMTVTNKYGLVSFLVANLVTGAVNLSINTLEYNDAAALGIIATYITFTIGIIVVLDASLSRKSTVASS